MKVLVVEDEPTAAKFLAQGLREEGFAVDVATTAAQADEAVVIYEYDALLLDVMIPGGDGFALCARWRGAGLRTPILFLTARDAVDDRVRGLDLGGDDYLVKPYAFDELLARIRSLIRRSQAQAKTAIQLGEVRIDLARRRVFRGNQEISLTAREYQLLEFLAHNAGKVVSRSRLWEHVWE